MKLYDGSWNKKILYFFKCNIGRIPIFLQIIVKGWNEGLHMDKLLRFLVESGKISEEEVNKEMEAMERTEILKKHPYKITDNRTKQ